MGRGIFKRISIILALCAVAVGVWGNRTGKFVIKPFAHGGETVVVSPSTSWPKGIVEVKLGTFIENVYDFSIATQSVAAETVVWVVWPEAFQHMLDVDGLSIDQVIGPLNRVNSWDATTKPLYTKPLRLPDGSHYQIFRFSGRFYADVVDLHRYPFEKLTFPVIFGVNPMSDRFTADKVRLVADSEHSGLGSYVDIVGFATDGFSVSEQIQKTPTNFGFGDRPSSAFSQVKVAVDYKKSGLASIQQLILPLLIVMLIVLVAPNLAASLWDVRIAIPSTVLLTLVFLQQSYRQNLPLLPYITFLDQVYAECYLVTFGLFCLFVWTSNVLDSATEAERPAVIARLNKTDAWVQFGFVLFLVFGTTLNWLFPLPH